VWLVVKKNCRDGTDCFINESLNNLRFRVIFISMVNLTKATIIYRTRKKKGLCPNCGGKVKKNSSFIFCDNCRENYRNYQEENKEKLLEIKRNKYEDRKNKKLCPRCGTFVGKKSKTVLCSKCLDRLYKNNTGAKRPK